MKNTYGALFGIGAIATIYLTIGVCVLFAPWFSWDSNALSDFGNMRYRVAPIFNFGFALAGFLFLFFAIFGLRGKVRLSYYGMIVTAFLVQLVGVFNESYGWMHANVAMACFAALIAMTLAFIYETRSPLAIAALMGSGAVMVWLFVTLLSGTGGIAIPETLLLLMGTPWLASLIMKVYRD